MYILGGLALYLIILGTIGIRMVKGRSNGCVTLFSVLFFVLIALHATIAGGFLFEEDKTVDVLKDLNSNGNNDSIRNYIDNNRQHFKYAALGVLAIELLTFCMAICCQDTVSGAADEDYSELDAVPMDNRGLLSAGSNYTEVSATPQTDIRRAQIAEKYGDRYSKSTTS